MYSIVRLLKNDMEGYRSYLRNTISEWEVKALAAFRIMKENVDKYLYDLYEEGNRAKDRLGVDEDLKNKCRALQQDIDQLNKSLEKEKENVIVARRESAEREERLKKVERTQHQ